MKHVSLFRHSSPFQAGGGRDPDIIVKNASESKGGVIEKFIKVFLNDEGNTFTCIRKSNKI